MHLPRIRFTIGRMMSLAVLLGLACWILFIVRPQFAAVRQAEASSQQATLVREVAESAVNEYEHGIYVQDKATYEGQIAVAESDKRRAMERLGKTSTTVADRLTVQQAVFDLEQARTQLEVLEKYTKDKQIKSLRSDVAKARADELSKLEAYRLERARRRGLVGF